MQKILVTGSNGQLGSELQQLSSSYPSFEFIFLTRTDVSLTDLNGLRDIVIKHQPNFVINCAAYTAVDKAESEKEEAFLINASAPEVLATVCAELNAGFLHISTDYVFDGTQQSPRKEDDAVQPINVYGETKLVGEQKVFKKNPKSIVIRTSWVYSAYGKNFVKTMMRLMNEKESISVVNDQWGSPTYAADLAKAVVDIIKNKNWQPGIYHFSNEGTITWFDFAKEISTLINTNCIVNSTTTANFPTPAKRPLYSVMDKEKIQQAYQITIRSWKESLKECIAKLQE